MDYRFSAYEVLMNLKEALSRYPNPKLGEEINALITQVQNRKYVVAVAGDFNRGKSSLINALLGMPILPMDILPTTATANRIVYGLTPRVTIHTKDGGEQQIKVDELADYVTKLTEEKEQVASTIRETVIEYPTILCQNGLEILDTPGLNDTEEMSRITSTILQEAHAVVFAISALMPLSMTEVDWLAGMIDSEQLQYIMFAVTFFDRVAKRDRDKVLDNIRERISTMVQSRVLERSPDRPDLLEKAKRLTAPETMFLMPVSSRDALDSFDLGDDELLQNSNLPQFKKELLTVLNAQQDEYVIRRAIELHDQVSKWMHMEDSRRVQLKEAEQQLKDCDAALMSLSAYAAHAEKEIEQLSRELNTSFRNAPNAYGTMKAAAHAVIDAHEGRILTNDDVHATLHEATAAAMKVAKQHYAQQWKETGLPALNQRVTHMQYAHDGTAEKCRKMLESVPQLLEFDGLKKKMWGEIGQKGLPELPQTWSLDITGGILKGVVEGSKQTVEKIGSFMSDTMSHLEKKYDALRRMKEKVGEFSKKSGFSDMVGNIKLPNIEVKEGQLTDRNLKMEIEPMLSEGTKALLEQWQQLPQHLGQILRQIFLRLENLAEDQTLRLALTKRKGEAEALVASLSKDYSERSNHARTYLEKAEAILDEAYAGISRK